MLLAWFYVFFCIRGCKMVSSNFYRSWKDAIILKYYNAFSLYELGNLYGRVGKLLCFQRQVDMDMLLWWAFLLVKITFIYPSIFIIIISLIGKKRKYMKRGSQTLHCWNLIFIYLFKIHLYPFKIKIICRFVWVVETDWASNLLC